MHFVHKIYYFYNAFRNRLRCCKFASPTLTPAPVSAHRQMRKVLCLPPARKGPVSAPQPRIYPGAALQPGPAAGGGGGGSFHLVSQPLPCCMQISDTLCCLDGRVNCGAAAADPCQAGLRAGTGWPRRRSRYGGPDREGQGDLAWTRGLERGRTVRPGQAAPHIALFSQEG